MKVYLDNAATTPIDENVLESMLPYMRDSYGNPSSIHSHGREVRSAIEQSRKKVAELLNTSPSEIFFTSGGTEADNMALCSTIESHGIQHVITSKLEHHAVLHTVEYLEKVKNVKVSYVKVDRKGNIDFSHFENLLKGNSKSLVSLMHGNNEIGNILDLSKTGDLCSEYGAILHSDTVQTVGHYKHDLEVLKTDFIVGSAHKFHGPKGVGFLYINANTKISPYIHGGAQERNMRGGTENVYGIVGLAKALEIAYSDMQDHRKYVLGLKQKMIYGLKSELEDIAFNGDSEDVQNSLYTVLNVCLPKTTDNDMLLFNLDINQISASAGSACSSGSSLGSHVLQAIGSDPNRGAVRFSFSKYNTEEEINYVVEKLANIFKPEKAV
ncbi:MAG: cysteine desulfurase family protein [Bacteroidota bacterium]